MRFHQPPFPSAANPRRRSHRLTAFTLLDLLAMIAVIAFGVLLVVPSFARTRSPVKSLLCRNNMRQLMSAWTMYAEDSGGKLPSSDAILSGTPAWMPGYLDYQSASRNWNDQESIWSSPLFPYTGANSALFRCTADPTYVTANGMKMQRVRTVSMSQVFGRGEWLNKVLNTGPYPWRTYRTFSAIVVPSRTFVFIEEHPDSLNDGGFAVPCTGNEPQDPAANSHIVDYPASLHDAGCVVSMADGSVELQIWQGTKIRQPIKFSVWLSRDVPAEDSWLDMHWLAERTSVRAQP